MKKYLTSGVVFIWVILLLLPACGLKAEQFSGSNGLQYSTSAKPLQKGVWKIMSHSRASLVSVDGMADDVTNVTGAISVNYGIWKNLELEITSLLYQDINNPDFSGETNTPDGGYFRWKYGNIRLTNQIVFGLQGTARGTIGDFDNVWLEPYYSEAYSGQLNLLFSYFRNPDFPEEDIQVHYNFGYINYNDAEEIGESTDAIKVYLGIKYPFSDRLSGSIESQGTYFLGYPDFSSRIFSMEEYGYITPSVTYSFTDSWAFMTGIDILVYERDNIGSTVQPASYPNYPSWRVTSKLIWTPFGEQHSGMGKRRYGGMGGRDRLPVGSGYDIYNRTTLYDWGGYVREDIEYVEIELDKIRQDRKKAEEDLQKIKDKLKKEQNPPSVEEPQPIVEPEVVPEEVPETDPDTETTEDETNSETQEEPPPPSN